MANDIRCNFCKKSAEKYIEAPKDFEYFSKRMCSADYYICRNCQILFQDPMPSNEECSTFYTSDYQNYSRSKVPFLGYLFTLMSKISLKDFVKKVDKNSYILDYGCNQGQYLDLLSSIGYIHLYGYDVVKLDIEKPDHFTFYGDLKQLISSGIKFDFIRMNHVIEHLPHLDEVMTELVTLLKPTGKIIGQTPNSSHYTLGLFKRFWGCLHYPYHTMLFSPKALQKNSPNWGLFLTKSSPSIMPTGWAMSIENIIKSSFQINRRGRIFVYPIIIVFCLPLALFDRLFFKKISTSVFDFELKRKPE